MSSKDPTFPELSQLARANPARLDLFAAAALTGLLSRLNEEDYVGIAQHNWDCLTDLAVIIADDMLWSIQPHVE